MDQDRVDLLRAIDALRAGVPNRDVVRQMQPTQANIAQRFGGLLQDTEAGWSSGRPSTGMMIEGEFGQGKSHWLEYLRHVALERGFVCSSVVLSKETPLHDLSKLYRACVESATAPDKAGPILDELELTYKASEAPHGRDLFRWVDGNADVDPRFGATLYVFEKTHDAETRQRILAEWTGYPMKVEELRAALKAVGNGADYRVGRALKAQARQRFQFLSRFFRSAGYPGWVLLIDEAETMASYSLRQRGRAYAHLAWLVGATSEVAIPGIAAVFTITKDYAGAVLRGGPLDIDQVPARLAGTRDEPYIEAAELGMAVIEGTRGRPLDLRPLGRAEVMQTYGRVRDLYSRAYGWEAPEIESPREYMSSTSMREYVRSWITVWDLRRLYDYEARIVAERVEVAYDEDADLQEDDSADPEGAETIL